MNLSTSHLAVSPRLDDTFISRARGPSTNRTTHASPSPRKFKPLILVGPSGAGKSTLVKHLLALHPDKYLFSVSSTTRAPRPGEVDGVHYHFTSFEDFQSDLNKGLFLEHQEVHGNFYGTHLSQVQRAPGKVVILDIDVKGAL